MTLVLIHDIIWANFVKIKNTGFNDLGVIIAVKNDTPANDKNHG